MPTTPRDRTTSGTITTNVAGQGNTVDVDVTSYCAAGIQVTGTWTGTLTFEATVDGTNYGPIGATPAVGGLGVTTTTTANGIWSENIAGWLAIRVRATAAMTGSAVVTILASLYGTGSS
jgi:hypothetical protein